MPTATVNGTEYYYEDVGSGFPIVFAHGLTFDRRMWTHQVQRLSKKYRCLSLDFRGHGRSASPEEEYTLEQMTEDVYQLMQQVGVEKAHIVGLSMGGFVALRLALAHPEVVQSLVLLDTSAEAEVAERIPQYEAMAQMAREQGPQSVVDAVLPLMFSQAFLQGHPDEVQQHKEQFLSINRTGVYNATLAVTRRRDILGEISRIQAPTLIIVGEKDIATTPDKSERMHERIRGSRLERIPSAGHMTPIEQPERVTELIEGFLAGVA